MARPKLISDQKILQEAYEQVIKYGPHKLTFDQLGTIVGLVPAALVRRFKNKQQLLLEIDRFALEHTNAEVEKAMKSSRSAVEAIIAQFVAELGFATNIERYANGQEFLLMDLREKNLYGNYRASFEHRHQQVVTLLKEAEASGELQGIDDPHTLARHLEMILHGAGHMWAMSQENSIAEYIAQHVNFALKPYQT